MHTPIFVSGPYALNERSLIIDSPHIAVLFKNGVAHKVLQPGVHRTITGDLPFFGQQNYLLFDAAPFGFTIALSDIRLRDNTLVELEAKVWVEPSWLADPNAIFDYAQQFGLRSERYLETVEHALYDVLRRQILTHCLELSHDQFISTDLGHALALDRIRTDLVSVARVVGVTAIQDTNVVDQVRTGQTLRNRMIFDEYEDSLVRRRAIAKAQVDAELAKLYRVDAWSVANPSAANRLRLEAARALRELVTEYRDMLPPEDIRRADAALISAAQVRRNDTPYHSDEFGGQDAPPGRPHVLDDRNDGSVNTIGRAIRSELTRNPSVLTYGLGVQESASGTVACVAAGVTSGDLPISDPDGFAQEHGLVELNILPVTRFDSPADVALELLDSAFRQYGMPTGEVDVTVREQRTLVIISLTGEVADPERVARRLLCWTDALSELVKPYEIQVDLR